MNSANTTTGPIAAGHYVPGPDHAADWHAGDEGRFNASSIDVSAIIAAVMRWRWLMLGALLLSLLAAAIYTFLATPMYRAEATLEIRQQRVELLEGADVEAVAVRDPTFMETQFALLRSGSLAVRVARDTRLADNPVLGLPDGLTREAREGAALLYIVGGINISQVGNSRLVKISFVGDDAQAAAAIANSYVRNFIRSDSDRRVATTASARQLLTERVASARASLEASERAMVEYAQAQGIVEINPINTGSGAESSANGSLDATMLVATSTALSAAENERIHAQQVYEQSRAAGVSRAALDSSAAQGMRTTLAQLEAEYAQQSQTYLDTYPAQQALRQRILELRRELGQQEGQYLRSLRADYLAANAKVGELRNRLDSLSGRLTDTRNRSIQYNILQREVDTNRQLYDALLQRFKEIGVAGQIGSDLASPVDPAAPPSRPFSPNLLFNLLLALGGGLVLGGALVFLAFIMDDTIKSPEDVKQRLRIAALGAVPEADEGRAFIEASGDSQSAVSEAYFSARAAIDFATSHGAPKSIAITSATAGEGKSSTALGLARSFAKNGKRVLLIDADLRRPTLTSDNGNGRSAESTKGLSLLLTSDARIEEHLEETIIDNIWAIASGPIPPSPTELLSSRKMVDVVRGAEELFDLVLVDAPPVLGLADAPLIGGVCQALLFVVRAGGPRRKVVLGALSRLLPSGTNIIGAIVTFVAQHRGGYYYSGVYQYLYADSTGGKLGKGGRKLPILKR